MKLGVLTNLFGGQKLEDVLIYLKSLGIEAVEIGCGGYPGTVHADAKKMLADPSAVAAFQKLLNKYEMTLSALSVHGNPVHPDREIAAGFHSDFEAAVLLAERLGIERVITFSGCPGDSEGAKYPNWVTCPWPEDFLRILDWQWNEVLIPYWKKASQFALEHGVNKICLEMHPGFCVYNPETLLRLRGEVGDVIGVNFDPSHLFWQGIDPVAAIRALGDAVYHFHAKDTKIDPYNAAVNGVLDTKHYGAEHSRSWIFRTVGYGSNQQVWRDMVSELRKVNYDFVMSIEHEDSLMTPDEGLKKAVAFLKETVIKEPKPAGMSWA